MKSALVTANNESLTQAVEEYAQTQIDLRTAPPASGNQISAMTTQQELFSHTSDGQDLAYLLSKGRLNWSEGDSWNYSRIMAANFGGQQANWAYASQSAGVMENVLAGAAVAPGGGAEIVDAPAIQAGEVTTYKDFVSRSVVGDDIEGHELWQNANLEANGLASGRLSTAASKDNPVIALDRSDHIAVNAGQNAFDAVMQTPIEK